MKKIIFFSLLLSACFTFIQCGSETTNSGSVTSTSTASGDGTTIMGTIANAANIKIFLDKSMPLSKTNRPIARTEIDGSGKFSLNTNTPIDGGLYRLRIGAKKIFIALGKGDNNIRINGDLNSASPYDYSIEGSKAGTEFQQATSEWTKGKINQSNIAEKTAGLSAIPSMFLAANVMSNNSSDAGVEFHKAVNKKLNVELPGSDYAKDYGKLLTSIDQPIRLGKTAPDIRLNDPNGKEYALSDLKGKVVLLDFWASWCRPCRVSSPKLVELYKKYNKKGFEIFSVSLDRANAIDRWKKAIKDDGLDLWPYHVSELNHWNGQKHKEYGVSGIPATFLIGKDGTFIKTKFNPLQTNVAALSKDIEAAL